MKCWNCNQHGHRKAECPVIQCFRCGNMGHMARACNRSRHHYEDEESEEDYENERCPDKSDSEDEESEDDYVPTLCSVEDYCCVLPAAIVNKQELEDSKSPSRTEMVQEVQPLEQTKFPLSTVEFKAIQSFYLDELSQFLSKLGGTVTLTTPGDSKAVVCICTRDMVSSVKEKVEAVKKDIRDKSGSWKLSTSESFARSPVSQNSLLVSGVLAMSAETFASKVERKLTSAHIDAAVDITTLPAARNLGNIMFVTSKSIVSIDKVDVLVSVVGKDMDMRKTAVGKAVLERSGSQEKELRWSVLKFISQTEDGKSMVIRTRWPETGTLPVSSTILHTVLRTHDEGGASDLKQIVRMCLSQAALLGKQTIAFPPLGVGRRFGYPENVSAKYMVSATLEFLKASTSITRVVFATNDSKVAAVFEREVKKQTAEFLEKIYPDDKHCVALGGELKATLFTKDKGNLSQAAGVLAKILQDTFLAIMTVCDVREYNELATSATEHIEKMAAEKGVRLKEMVTEGRAKLVAQGQQECIQHIADFIKGKMYEAIRQKKEQTSDTHRLPAYWKLCSTYSSIPEAVAGMAAQEEIFQVYKVDDIVAREIKQLVEETWKDGVVGLGKNARNLTHTIIEILSVHRIENPEMWERYSEKREKLLRRLRQTHQKRLPPLENIPNNSGPVLTTSSLSPGSVLKREIYTEVNEHYLFHGTKKECVRAIFRDGLDNRFSKERPMLGRGIYGAESPTKSDQYTDASEEFRTGDMKQMLLVRMLLGEPYINTEPRPPKFIRPPCKKCREVLCNCLNVHHFDSVVDDSGRLFREFVVYEQCQCYPEYFIIYRRV